MARQKVSAATAETNGASGSAKAKPATNRIASITIQPLKIQRLVFELRGISPLVTQPMSVKTAMELTEKQSGGQKSNTRPPRCPEDEFLESFYWIDDDRPKPTKTLENGLPFYEWKGVEKVLSKARFGVPLSAFKKALVAACRNTELAMARAKQQLFVYGPEHPEFAIIKGKPEFSKKIVRVPSTGAPMERFRPMWNAWSLTIGIEFDGNMLNADQVSNLLQTAGHYVGVCEGRPEKSALDWGRFEIVT